MAAYADYKFYKNNFYGDILAEDVASKWLCLASDEIDSLTFGRLSFAFPTVDAHVEKVGKAVCAVAEALYNIDLQYKAAGVQQAADGSYRGAVSSISSGRAATSIYAAAAVSAEERTKLISGIIVKYLANVPDANGINLLYAGGMHRVSKYDNGF